MTKPGHLTVICGLPGSGKTTLARALARGRDVFHCNADDWFDHLGFDLWDESLRARVEALQWTVGQQMLRNGVDVVVEWGTWARSERDALREGARALGATVDLIFLDAPTHDLWRRTSARGQEDPAITEEQLAEWSTIIQRPTTSEFELYDLHETAEVGVGFEAEVAALETAMWSTATRGDREWMDRHLAPEFEEFGRSGRHWSRCEVIDAEIGEIDAVSPLDGLRSPPSDS